MNREQALHSFYSSFGIPAYEENTIPKTATMPYLTYEVITDSLSEYPTALTCRVWTKSQSWKTANELAEAISNKLKNNCILVCDYGYIALYRGSPFAQNVSDESDATVKGKYINISAEYITI